MIAKEKYPVAVTPMAKPTRHGWVWVLEDYVKLIKTYIEGGSSVEVAKVLERTPKVAVSMLANLGLLQHGVGDFYHYMRAEMKFLQDLEDISTVSIQVYRIVPVEEFTKLSRYFVMGMPIAAIAARIGTSKLGVMEGLERLGYVYTQDGAWHMKYSPMLAGSVKTQLATVKADDTAQGSVIESPAPCSSTQTVKEDTMIAIENRTYINDTNAADMTDDQVFNKIAELERDMAKLEAIRNKPKKLMDRINEMQEAITKLVKYVDERP